MKQPNVMIIQTRRILSALFFFNFVVGDLARWWTEGDLDPNGFKPHGSARRLLYDSSSKWDYDANLSVKVALKKLTNTHPGAHAILVQIFINLHSS